MKLVDMRKKSEKELLSHADKLRLKLADLKREIPTQEVKNNQQLRQTRRELAQTLTIINEMSNTQEAKETK